MVVLTAPSVHASTGVSFGGLTYDGTVNGVPVGNPVSEEVKPDIDGKGYTFHVTPGTLALLTLPDT